MTRHRGYLLAAIAALVVLALASLMTGAALMGPRALISAATGADPLGALVLYEIRLPRTLLALIIGAGLGAAGAALQGLLRNPLAEPSILGAPQTAALAAVIALYSGLTAHARLALPLAAFLGALLALGILLAVARRASGVTAFLLAGVAISSIAGALMALVLSMVKNPFAFTDISFWLMGSFEDVSSIHVALAAPPVALGLALIFGHRSGLNALTLGEDAAASSGIDLKRLRLAIAAGVALITGGAVAAAGAIGFVGLAAPHLVRPFVGYEPARVILPSAIAGGALLLAADILVRLVPATIELKIGVVTSLIGVPLFLWIVLAQKSGAEQ